AHGHGSAAIGAGCHGGHAVRAGHPAPHVEGAGDPGRELTRDRMIPKDPGFEARVRESFARQSHLATLGVTIQRMAPGEVDLAIPFDPRFCQQNGYLHAGAITSVADSASGYAAYTLAPPDTDVLAVEFKINLLAPARGEGFLACARVLRAGRTLTVCQ